MNIINYFKGSQWLPDGWEPDPECAQVAELARGCARENHIVLAVIRPQNQNCMACTSTNTLMACRVPMGGKQVVGLLCPTCVKRMAHQSGHGLILKWLRSQLKADLYEMAYLFRQGQRIRIVWGRQLESEALS